MVLRRLLSDFTVAARHFTLGGLPRRLPFLFVDAAVLVLIEAPVQVRLIGFPLRQQVADIKAGIQHDLYAAEADEIAQGIEPIALEQNVFGLTFVTLRAGFLVRGQDFRAMSSTVS